MANTTRTKTESVSVKSEVQEDKIAPKKFSNTDLIDCMSITNGELLMIGNKTKNLYTWANYNDVTAVEYQDLIYEVRSARNSFATYPRFIIMDEDFVEQNSSLRELYDGLYKKSDIKELLKQNADVVKATLPTLPKGVQESVKGMASTMIENGSLDKLSVIKVLDEFFETELLQSLDN